MAGQAPGEPRAGDAHADFPWLGSYPDGIDWHADLPPRPLHDIFDEAVRRHSSRPCTIFLGQTLSYGEIGELTERLAAGLSRAGLEPGTRVALVLPNTPYYIVAYYALLKLGAVVVNVNPLYTVEEMDHQFRDAGCEMAVTLDLAMLFDKVHALVERGTIPHALVCPFADLLPTVKKWLFRLFKRREVADTAAAVRADSLLHFRELTGTSGTYPRHEPDIGSDLAVLQYTGGTTGTPKGAMLTHANLSANIQQISLWFAGAREGEEVMLAVLPFFHVFGMTGVMNFGLSQGYSLVLMPRFDLDEAIGLIRRYRPTILPGVPTLFNALMNSETLSGEDLSSLSYCVSGGAPLPLEVRRGFEERAQCSLVEGYGLSETSPVTNLNPFKGLRKDGSIGQPVPGTVEEIRSLDDPASPVPPGEKGELCIAGPQVMKGYWNNEAETEQSFTGAFFRTGDVGYMDEDGFVYLVDRIKDIIVCSGFNVYPRRIEEAIYEHPAVEETTVVGVSDDYRGETPKAYIRLRAGQSLGEDELRAFLEPKLSKIEMPDYFEFRDELPKTLVGKLSKKELREGADSGDESDGKADP
ncbi:long-chain-fatty-acid--CoA ligase [Kaustia mangrovi]|uniref:long-chain-fatty-acid--CoA ligase n=1 Tax=Kaustia mangrovi TaxID=2593653 RepID=UPI001FE8CB07|nr:long-chain fatty acid--CoA ligase [Kaustia mangrovi]